MDNSFYYFFSATPQVLAGMLALFGVFVIFKIQNIKSELLSVGQVIYNYVLSLSGTMPIVIGVDDVRKMKLKAFRDLLNQWILSKDVKKLRDQINKIDDKEICEDYAFQEFKKKYEKEYSFLINIINDTVKSSIFTAIIIIVCIMIIPFGNIIICHPIILNALFGAVIICVGIIFYKLIKILKISIEE